jgi:hypothetical protein
MSASVRRNIANNSLQHLLLLLELHVILLGNVRESPLLRDDDLLATGELVPCPTQSLHDDRGVRILASDGEDNLADVDTGDSTVGLAPSTTHASLETTMVELSIPSRP